MVWAYPPYIFNANLHYHKKNQNNQLLEIILSVSAVFVFQNLSQTTITILSTK